MISQYEKDKRTQKRHEESVKTSTSIRFSAKEREMIQEKADECGMGFSEYVREKAKHPDQVLTPYQKVKIQNLVNIAYEQIKDSDPDKAQAMMKEVQDIWTM